MTFTLGYDNPKLQYPSNYKEKNKTESTQYVIASG